MANLFLASMSLFCTALTINLHQHSTSTKPPKWLTVLAHDYMAPLTGIRSIELRQKEANDLMSIYVEQLTNDKGRRNADVNGDVARASTVPTSSSTPGPTTAMQDNHAVISKLLAALTGSIVAKQKEEEAKNRIQSEWSSIGDIFDRFFFLLFLTAAIAVTVGMIGGGYLLFAAATFEQKNTK